MTFREYITRRRRGDNPQGDFVEDARRDGRLPDAQSWPELKLYLMSRGTCGDAVEAAHAVWRGYQAAVRRQSD